MAICSEEEENLECRKIPECTELTTLKGMTMLMYSMQSICSRSHRLRKRPSGAKIHFFMYLYRPVVSVNVSTVHASKRALTGGTCKAPICNLGANVQKLSRPANVEMMINAILSNIVVLHYAFSDQDFHHHPDCVIAGW